MNGKVSGLPMAVARTRRDDVAAEPGSRRRRHEDVKPEKRREGGEDADGEAERDGVRRAAEAEHPLPEIAHERATSRSLGQRAVAKRLDAADGCRDGGKASASAPILGCRA